MKDYKTQYGPWALVTGASSGIGQEFARQLAATGLNLVLTARRIERLNEMGENLKKAYSIEVRTVQADLSKPDSVEILAKATEGLEIGLLVNSAGVETHGAFLKNDRQQERNLIQLNAITPMELAHHFGLKMAGRKRGGIIFVSSTLAYQAVPFFANYAASKAYIATFGEALNYELKKQGVDVTVLSPCLTNTEMYAKMDGVEWSKMPVGLMEVEPVVTTALAALGKKYSVIPGGRNNFMAFLSKRLMSRKANAEMFGSMMEKAMAGNKL